MTRAVNRQRVLWDWIDGEMPKGIAARHHFELEDVISTLNGLGYRDVRPDSVSPEAEAKEARREELSALSPEELLEEIGREELVEIWDEPDAAELKGKILAAMRLAQRPNVTAGSSARF